MPWISVEQRTDHSVAASGDPAHAAGHRIPLADGTTDGIHAGWTWDGSQLRLEHDRYGFYPLFSWTTPTCRAIATDLSELLAAGAPRTLDYDALSVFLRVGFFVGEDSPFDAIRAIPPSTVSTPRTYRTDDPRQDRTALLDSFIDTFRTAIARRLPQGPFQMPLSGGRDSRHILLALIEAGRSPEACVTIGHFPPRGNDDIAVAAAVCGRLGVRHVVLAQREDRIAVEREKNLATHFCTDEHAQFVALAAYLRTATPLTYDGIAGDVLSQSSYFTPEAHAVFQRRDPDACAHYVLDGYGSMVTERALSRLVAPALLREMPRQRAVARLAREIAAHLDAPNPVASFFFWNRTRRAVALSPFALMRGLTVYAPYLDRDVFDLLTSLPAELVMDRRLHTEAIARAYPAVADLPYEARTVARRRPWLQRQVAAAVGQVVRASPGVLNAPALAPGILATLVDGHSRRLWHTALAIYLAQVGALASLDR